LDIEDFAAEVTVPTLLGSSSVCDILSCQASDQAPWRAAGVRATIYKFADEHRAFRYTKNPVFYVENNGTLLIMNLYFATPSDARWFMGDVTERGFYWGLSLVQVTCPPMFTRIVLPFDEMQSLYRRDYNTNDNVHSPKFLLYDVGLERVLLNDLKHLQMFEKPPVNSEIGTYKCHL
jgi:hypothetical protein